MKLWKTEKLVSIVVLATIASVVLIAATVGSAESMSLLPFGLISILGLTRHSLSGFRHTSAGQ